MEEALEASNDLVLEVQGPMAITSNMMCHVGLTGASFIATSLGDPTAKGANVTAERTAFLLKLCT